MRISGCQRTRGGGSETAGALAGGAGGKLVVGLGAREGGRVSADGDHAAQGGDVIQLYIGHIPGLGGIPGTRSVLGDGDLPVT